MDRAFQKQVFKFLAMIVGCIFLCRITNGYFAPLLAFAGVWMALSNRTGYALCCYVFFPFLVIINPLIMPGSAPLGMSLRLAPLAMGILLMFSATKRSGHQRLPLGFLFAYLVCAALSSIDGYCPQVSFLKIINCVVFFIGLWFGTQNIHTRPKDILLLRAFFTAMAFFLIFGSLVTLLFPGIAYPNNVRQLMVWQKMSMEEAMAVAGQSQGMSLFAGVTNHSQCLAPMSVCCFAWILCDMLFVMRKFSKWHLLAIGVIPFFLYMTRSRLGLLSLVFTVVMVFGFAGKKLSLPFKVRKRASVIMYAFIGLAVAASIVGEIKSQALTRWIRKTDNLETDSRTTEEALTTSRMGLIEFSLRDYRANPLLGKGFQVDERVALMYEHSNGMVMSASIEKGVLPVMVLGETGILGVCMFGLFLLVFSMTCMKKKYFVTLTMFSVLLITNMGEATFFSPGGMGGILWIFTVGGGFVIDSMLLYGRDFERRMRMIAR